MKLDIARPSTRTIGTMFAAGAAVLLGGLVLTGCGSSNAASQGTTSTTTTTTTTGTTGTTSSGSASFQAYQSCLKAHGVNLPQGGFGGGNGGGAPPNGAGGAPPSGGTGTTGNGRPAVSAAQQKAFTACASLRPAGGFGGGGFAGGAGANSNNPAFAKFQNCLKQHGVDPTDQNARNSSAFQSALSACRSLLPNGGAGFGGGAPPAGGAGGGGGGGQGNSSSFAKFQACLRSHGADPTAAGGQSAKTQAALNACQKLLSGGSTGTSTTTTTG